jgi:nucleotide-binding universal stress UspA family protein
VVVDSAAKRLLLASDGSEPAKMAGVEAAALAIGMGYDEVVVVTVVNPPLTEVDAVACYQANPFIPAAGVDECAAAERHLAEAVTRVQAGAPGIFVRSKLLHDLSPVRAICEEAHTGGYALIVIGSRGLGTFGTLALGSVSSGVIHNAEMPVLVVRG